MSTTRRRFELEKQNKEFANRLINAKVCVDSHHDYEKREKTS